jgi:hypothetical protein
MFRNLFVSVVVAGLCISAWSQAKPVAEAGRWQVGVGVSVGLPDYAPSSYITGGSLFATYDIGSRYGLVVEAHDLNLSTPKGVGQTSFLIGPHYGFSQGRFHFYVKVLAGAGLLQRHAGFYASNMTDVYEVFAGGWGMEYALTHHLNLRLLDFEYQAWPGVKPNGLTPWVGTYGVNYRF